VSVTAGAALRAATTVVMGVTVVAAAVIVAVSIGMGVPTTVAVAVTDRGAAVAVVVTDARAVAVIAGEGCVDVIDADAVVPERTVEMGMAGIAVPIWVAVMAVMAITGVGDAPTVAVIASDRGEAPAGPVWYPRGAARTGRSWPVSPRHSPPGPSSAPPRRPRRTTACRPRP